VFLNLITYIFALSLWSFNLYVISYSSLNNQGSYIKLINLMCVHELQESADNQNIYTKLDAYMLVMGSW